MPNHGNPLVGMRLDQNTIARIDCLASAWGLSRGQLVRRALESLPEWPDTAAVLGLQDALPGQIGLEDLQQAQKAMP